MHFCLLSLLKLTFYVNLRLAAQRRGFLITKRRDKKYAPGLGSGYMIMDVCSGAVVAGHKYDMTPEDVRDFLNEH